MISDAGTGIAAFGAGAVVGLMYFLLLWIAVRAWIWRAGSLPVQTSGFVLLALLRAALVVGCLFLAIQQGATATQIACAGIGFLAARSAMTALLARRAGGQG